MYDGASQDSPSLVQGIRLGLDASSFFMTSPLALPVKGLRPLYPALTLRKRRRESMHWASSSRRNLVAMLACFFLAPLVLLVL